jgi:hypothetical protein
MSSPTQVQSCEGLAIEGGRAELVAVKSDAILIVPRTDGSVVFCR